MYELVIVKKYTCILFETHDLSCGEFSGCFENNIYINKRTA